VFHGADAHREGCTDGLKWFGRWWSTHAFLRADEGLLVQMFTRPSRASRCTRLPKSRRLPLGTPAFARLDRERASAGQASERQLNSSVPPAEGSEFTSPQANNLPGLVDGHPEGPDDGAAALAIAHGPDPRD
jgi:hypothetical protein